MSLVGFNGDSQDATTMQAESSDLGVEMEEVKEDGQSQGDVSIGDASIDGTQGLQAITLSDGTTALVQSTPGMKR